MAKLQNTISIAKASEALKAVELLRSKAQPHANNNNNFEGLMAEVNSLQEYLDDAPLLLSSIQVNLNNIIPIPLNLCTSICNSPSREIDNVEKVLRHF
jgi:hypothetical protein